MGKQGTPTISLTVWLVMGVLWVGMVWTVFARGEFVNVSLTITIDAKSAKPLRTADTVQVEVVAGQTGEAIFVCDESQWLNQAGEPAIPWKVLTIVLPPDVEVSSVSASMRQSEFQRVAGTWTVALTPAPVALDDGKSIVLWPEDKRIIGGRDVDIYERDNFWPDNQGRLLGTGQLHSWRLAEVAVPLARYNPVRGELLLLTEVEIEIGFDRTGKLRAEFAYGKTSRQLGESRVRQIAFNYEEGKSYYERSDVAQVDVSGSEETPGYTVITTSDINDTSSMLAEFCEHKETLGFNVQIITETGFGGGTGDTAAENIRAWLGDHYVAGNIQYVLLIGDPRTDIGEIPMKALYPGRHWPDDQLAASDLYYADLTGNWDLDGDGYYGEWPDANGLHGDFGSGGVDRYWEVLVGRIPCYGDVNDVDTILQKTIIYETSESVEWRKKALLPMQPLSEESYTQGPGEAIKDDILIPGGWDYHRIYPDDYNLVPPPESIMYDCNYGRVAEIWRTEKPGLIVWHAHGSAHHASCITWVGRYVQMLNDDYPGFTFQASCSNSRPEVTDNLSFELLKHGAVCTIGATAMSWSTTIPPYAGSTLATGMAYEYASRVVWGSSSAQALHDLKQVFSPTSYIPWKNFAIFNIYGDPALRIIASTRSTLYVDENAPGPIHDGNSWPSAFKYLQDALEHASVGREIRVAKGTYKPDANAANPNGSGEREATFRLKNGVTIAGGYAGYGERDPDTRATETYKTILSGDIGVPGDANDNSYHVATGSATHVGAVLDGFTITGGNADGSDDHGGGGGMFNNGGDPSVIDCTFIGNSASGGGGMKNYHSSPTLTGCMFTGNHAGYGGAIYNGDWSSPVLTRCKFVENSSDCDGGAIRNFGWSDPKLADCDFSENHAGWDGGAICTRFGSPILANCTFRANTGNWGGAMTNNPAEPMLANCTFIGNSASTHGGGILSKGGSFPTLTNCTFISNTATEQGGAIFNWSDTTLEVSNCTFSRNSAASGSALACDSGDPQEPSDVFSGNCILWDEDSEISNSNGSTITVTYSDVRGGWPGEGNIDADPCFADVNNGDYHLKSEAGRWEPNSQSWVQDEVTSPCIDAGNPGCPVGDEPDPNGNRINMGAYGGTAEASKSPGGWRSIADLTNDWVVDYNDLAVFVGYWLESGKCLPSDLDRNERVDLADFTIFGLEWREAGGSGPGIAYEIFPCDPNLPAAEQWGETRFTVTVEGRYIHFEDMMMSVNCCPDELVVEMVVVGELITINEIEHTSMPCPCICDYPVTATLGPFEPGTYTLEVYQDGGFVGSTIATIGP